MENDAPRPQQQSPQAGFAPSLNGVRIPLLISGIFNCIAFASWGLTCVFIFIGIPGLVLAIFEFKTFAKLGSSPDPSQLRGRVKTIAIIEICSILLGNIASMVCGIITLANLHQLETHR